MSCPHGWQRADEPCPQCPLTLNSRSEMRRIAAVSPDTLVAEIERLRAENTRLRGESDEPSHCMDAHGGKPFSVSGYADGCLRCEWLKKADELHYATICGQLRADNARLREALAYYAEKKHIQSETTTAGGQTARDWPMRQEIRITVEDGGVARAALEGE